MLHQKRYTEDFLTKKMKVNQGEVPQYYVEGSHSGIVSSEVFDMAQKEMRERKDARRYASGDNCFSGKILCGECGSAYGSKVWHSTSKYRRIIWQCNNKFQNEHKCKTPHLYDDAIKRTFVEAFNSLIENKDAILTEYEQILEGITDSIRLEQEQKAVDQSCLDLSAIIERFVNENAHCAQDQNEFQKRYDEYVKQYQALHDRSGELAMQITRMKERRIQIMEFLNTLRVQDTLLTEFDSTLWCNTVTSLRIQSNTQAVFTFKDGTELPWPLTEC